jgi:1-acyl-sn-glycerol-3-phosphate acyltransferase
VRFLRGVVWLVFAPLLTAFWFFACCAGLPFDPKRGRVAHAAMRMWGRSVLWAAGVRLVVTGRERLRPEEARVLVANHSSYLDIPAAVAAFPGQLRFVARSTLIRLPFVGWYVWAARHFFVSRDDPRQAMRLMERIGRRMRRDGLSPLFFPEGTRSPNGRLAPLKPGVFLLPLTLEAPIQPVAILGAHEILPKGARTPRRRGVVEIRFGDAIQTAGRSGGPARKALATETRDALLSLGVPAQEAPREPEPGQAG